MSKPIEGRVLVYAEDAKDRESLAEEAARTVTAVSLVDTDSGPESVNPRDYDVVLFSLDGLEPDHRQKLMQHLRRWGNKSGAARPVLISSAEEGYATLFRELRSYNLTNLLARSACGVHSGDLATTLRKILSGDIFGIDPYFSGDVYTKACHHSSVDEVGGVLELAEEFTGECGIHPRVARLFSSALEELFMNAFTNLPERADEGASVEVCLAATPQRIGMAVTDPYGELSLDRALERLDHCFHGGSKQVELKDTGAGLGLYMVFDALSHLVVNVAPKKKTEVIGLVNLMGTYREFAKSSKSFNCFIEPAGS